MPLKTMPFRTRLVRTVMAALLALTASPLFAADSLQVKVAQGKLEGTQSGSIRAFLGIPYAAPPVGPLRWHEPEPAAKWHGTRQATSFGAHCMQPHLYADMIFRDPGNSEDCLTLNVWTPAKTNSDKLPVM